MCNMIHYKAQRYIWNILGIPIICALLIIDKKFFFHVECCYFKHVSLCISAKVLQFNWKFHVINSKMIIEFSNMNATSNVFQFFIYLYLIFLKIFFIFLFLFFSLLFYINIKINFIVPAVLSFFLIHFLIYNY